MSAARLAAQALALLGPVDGPIAVVGAETALRAAAVAAGVAVVPDGGAVSGALVSFLGVAAVPGDRQACLSALRLRLPAGAPVVLADHNQPRTWGRRLFGMVELALRGLAPTRARDPAARELQALGFHVERLHLASGERVQLVAARR